MPTWRRGRGGACIALDHGIRCRKCFPSGQQCSTHLATQFTVTQTRRSPTVSVDLARSLPLTCLSTATSSTLQRTGQTAGGLFLAAPRGTQAVRTTLIKLHFTLM